MESYALLLGSTLSAGTVLALAALTVNDTVAVTPAAPLAVLDSVTPPEVSAVALMAGNATLD